MTSKNRKYLVGAVSLIIFILITILVITSNITSFDDYIYSLVYKLRDSQMIDIFLKSITRLGDTIPTIIIVLILLLILKKEDKILLLSAEVITISINQIIKHIIRRPRPPLIERLIEQGGYSYPSGHSMMALCLYGTLIYIVHKRVKDKKLKLLLTTLLSIIILLIGLSRIYVRVHYPSDVLGGYTLTLPILIFTITILNNHFKGE